RTGLGEDGEREPGGLIRMGGTAIGRVLPDEVKWMVNRIVRRSVEYAVAHPDASLPYVRRHAQEMDNDVMYRHIDLYVNEYSIDFVYEGRHDVVVWCGTRRAR